MTSHIIQIGETKQTILSCSVAGMHNSSSVVEIRFNDDKSYSCRKTRWPSEPEGSFDKPHVLLLNDNTCQLTIPNATNSGFVDYYCRVKLQLFKRNCYLLSETIALPVETLTSAMPTSKDTAISITVPVVIAVVVIIVLLMTVLIVVNKAMKPNHLEPLCDPLNPDGIELEGILYHY